MSIVVRTDEPNAALGGVISAVGQSRSADRQAGNDESLAKFMLGLRQQNRQLDVNAALRLRDQDLQQRQYQQSLAAQDARQEQLLYSNEANRQASFAQQQMREEYDLLGQQQQQMFQYQAQAAKSVDEQVFDIEKASQQMQLNPEGQRIRNEKLGSLREIRAQRASVRPEVYASWMGQWLDDYTQSNIAAYEQKEPTAQEEAYANLVPLGGQAFIPGQAPPPGDYLFPVSVRNGVKSWKQITIPDSQEKPFAEETVKNSAPGPHGGTFYRQPDGKVTYIPPEKPEKAATEKPVDTGKYLKEAVNQLRTEHQLSQTGETVTAFKFDLGAAKNRAKELMKAEKELEAELAKADSGDSILKGLPDVFNAEHPQTMEEVAAVKPGKVFFWNGQYAEMNDDGTVTVIE